MIILFVTPFLRRKDEVPNGGGLEAYLFRMAGALKELGHVPVILSLGQEDLQYTENGIEIIFVKCSEMNMGKADIRIICNRLHQSIVINKKIRSVLKERKIDIIQFPSVYGLASCYFEKTPAVMRLSSYAKVYYKDFLPQKRVDLMAFFEKLGARRCSAVFAPSNVIARAFSHDICRNVSVIESPFWNDVQAEDDSVYRDKLSGKKYALFFGRLDVEKGVLVLAEILRGFLENNREYYFVCCGRDGAVIGRSSVRILRDSAGKYKERFLHINGLTHERLYPVIRHAEFVVMPSVAENFSNSCMEAMYFERVVIGTDGTSFEQLIHDGKSGLLCRPGDAQDLAEKMQEAVSMPEAQKKEIGRNAKARIDKLAPRYTVAKIIRYYEFIISKKRN